MSVGKVSLVGAGPGDPGLITVRGQACLEAAEVLLYDDLAHPDLADRVGPDCERIYVGKRAGFRAKTQNETNQLLVDYARAGRRVVRLKGGDPYVFGRGGEEALVLQAEGIPFEVVPGITSGFAGPAYAGIPVTHRGVATQVTLVTGHEDPAKPDAQVNWRALGAAGGTLVVYMGVGKRAEYVPLLVEGGASPETPVAAVRWGTRPEQHVVRGVLQDLPSLDIQNPAAIVIGEVAAMDLAWFEKGSLSGKCIVVTRTREQSSVLSRALRDAGAEVLEVPTIEIVDPIDWEPADDAIGRLDTFTWLMFASPNGVNRFIDRVLARTGDIRHIGDARIAAIGPATGDAVRSYGLNVDLVPDHHAAGGLGEALAALPNVSSERILLPRPEVARSEAPEMLRAAGAVVEEIVVYRTVKPSSISAVAMDRLAAGTVDMVTFTSSSTARHFRDLLCPDLLKRVQSKTVAGSIGPTTSATARECGFKVVAEALDEDVSVMGLVGAIHRYYK
jgi:uroporphyrinogen III methyltransferase/synthase